MDAGPPGVRTQASIDRQATWQPVTLLLQNPVLYEAVGYSAVPATAPGRGWTDWGNLLNRKVVVRKSELPGAGRGLFAGPAVEGGLNGFNPNDVITLYGGQLLTERQAREKEMEEHDYMLRVSAKDGSALAFVDGHQFADGLSREPDADGLYLPLPDPDDSGVLAARLKQGPGSVVNDPTLIINASDKVNAAFKFYQLGRGEQAKLLPRVPVVVATKHIGPGEEIFVRYGTDKPFLGDAVAAGTKRPRDEPQGGYTSLAAGDAGPSEAPTYRSLAAQDEAEAPAAVYRSAAAASSDDAVDANEDRLEDEELLAKLAELGLVNL